MDVEELRIAFNLSETITERIRNFKEKRLSDIIDNQIPIVLNDEAKLIIHLVPINSFNPTQHYDLSGLEMKRDILNNLFPMYDAQYRLQL